MKTQNLPLLRGSLLLAAALSGSAFGATLNYTNATLGGDWAWSQPGAWDNGLPAAPATGEGLVISIYNGSNLTFSSGDFSTPAGTAQLAIANATLNVASGTLGDIYWFGVGGGVDDTSTGALSPISNKYPQRLGLATLNIESGATVRATTLNIGYQTDGIVNLNGGTIDAVSLYIAGGANNSGQVISNGGTIDMSRNQTNNNFSILQVGSGSNSNGYLELNGGSLTSRSLNIAAGTGSTGNVVATNALIDLGIGTDNIKTLRVAAATNSTGNLHLTGGSLTGRGAVLGYGAGSNATITLKDTTFDFDHPTVTDTGYVFLVAQGANSTVSFTTENSTITSHGFTFGYGAGSHSTTTFNNSTVTDNGTGANWGFYLGYGGATASADVIANNSVLTTSRRLSIAAMAGATASFTLNGGRLSVGSETASGTLLNSVSYIGNGERANAIYTQLAGESFFANVTNAGSTLIVASGESANGTLNLHGGNLSVTRGNLVFAVSSNSTGRLNITGGNLSVNNRLLISTGGVNARTFVEMSGGNLSVTGVTQLGAGTGSFVEMDVSGGTVTMNKGDTHMSVGENSRSDLTLSGSAVMNTALLNVGYGSGARGNVTVNGGTLNVGGNIVAGINASGAVGNITVNGGTLNVTGQTQLGAAHAADAGSNAGDLIVKSGTFNGTGIGYVGNGIGSTGCLTVDGGLAKFTGALYIGANASSAGEVTVNGGTLQVGGSFYLGYYGASDAGTGATGNLTLNDGVINAGLTLGYGAFSSSVFTMNGGTFNTQTGYVNIGFSGAAEAVINNGTMNIHGTLRVAENTAGVTASLTIHNGTHIADIATPGSGGYHIIGGKGFGILNMDGGSLTVSSKVKLGRVAGATGTINLAGGSLSFGGLSIGNFNGGTGFVNISGGSLTTKALEMQTAGSKITFTIAGADFGSPFVINNTSDADIVIGAGLLVADLSGFAAADGSVDIILMTYNQINATPNDIEAALSSILDYGSQDASRFTNVSFVWKNALDPLKRELHLAFDYAAIPEPSTVAVLLGLLTLAFTRFRRR